MSMVVQGSDCVFKVRLSDDYAPLVCLKQFSISTITDTIEKTTKGDGHWKSFASHALSYTISLNGIVKVFDADANPHAFDLLTMQTQFIECPYTATYTDRNGAIKIIEGVAILTSSNLDVLAGQLADFSVELQGTGSYEIRDTLEGCETYIPDTFLNVSVIPSGGTVTIIINNIIGPWMQIDYIIDGGSRFTSYTNEFSRTGISAGEHTIQLIPVCTNGTDGEIFERTFTM